MILNQRLEKIEARLQHLEIVTQRCMSHPSLYEAERELRALTMAVLDELKEQK